MRLIALVTIVIIFLSGCKRSASESTAIPNKTAETSDSVSYEKTYQQGIEASVIEMHRLFTIGDIDGFIHYMHPKVIEMLGGPDGVNGLMKPGLEQMQKQIEEISHGQVSRIISEDDCLAAFVPVTMIHKIEYSRIHDNSYYIASSTDDGKTWKFISSQGKPEQEAFFKKIFPNLTRQIPFPKCGKKFIEQ